MALQRCLQPSTELRLPRAQTTQRIHRSLVVCAGQNYKIAVLPGDGIGPEITRVTLRALEAAGKKADVGFSFKEALIGGAAIDATGKPLPDETLEQCRASDAVLLAAIGG
jgi:isocitrate/isopropylmalate dehydrogenase